MTTSQKKKPFRIAFLILAGLGLVAFGLTLCTDGSGANSGNVYEADTPSHNTPERLMPGMMPLTAEQIARIPLADGFQWPVGAPGMAFMYDAQPFGTDNPQYGGKHCGQDLNGIGGENTDRGCPVRAIARGLVIYSGCPSESWGNMVIVAHRIPGSDTVHQSIYAHLEERKVQVGDVLYRGQELGTIGSANGRYFAHLHFEMAGSRVVEAGMSGYHPAGTMNRIDPQQFISEHPAPNFPDPFRDILSQLRLNEAFAPASR